jgi:hypothetical protein
VILAGAAVAVLLLDALVGGLERRWPQRCLAWRLLLGAAHAAVLAGAWTLWPLESVRFESALVGPAALAIGVIAFNASAGARLVDAALRGFLSPRDEDSSEGSGPDGAGWRIGILERWLILGLGWAGQWGAVGLVLTAKSVARFKKMDEQGFAEIYLIGTMTSALVAMVSGAVLAILL